MEGHYTQVSASWVQPSVNCSVAPTIYSKFWQAASFWAGFDGYFRRSDTVEQIGTRATCFNGRPIYSGWYELYPQHHVDFANVVKPGDKISASVIAHGHGAFTLILADPSEHWTRRKDATSTTARLTSAEVIAECPIPPKGYPRTLADFGRVRFTGVTANGTSFSDLNRLHPIDMVTNRRKQKATPGPIANGAFVVAWKHP